MMRVDPLRLAVLFPALWAAHAVGDHVVQTDWQAANKPRDWRAMAAHVGGYQATQAVIVSAMYKASGTPLRANWRQLAAGAAFSAVSHALLDRRWPVTRLLDATGSRGFARPAVVVPPGMVRPGAIRGEQFAHSPPASLPLHGPYLADQALHTACLLVSAAIMAVRR